MHKYNNFTVIIPEHNRPNHLKRLLEYYLSQNVHVIVADSSIKKFCFLEEYIDRISYHHFPQSFLAEKINYILPYIDTPYVVMCANDDFVIPNAVNIITEFLDNHLDYNSGQGIYIDFDTTDKSTKLSLRYPNMLTEQIDEDNGCDRVLHLMKSYFQYYYAVHRTSIFKEIYSSLMKDEKTQICNLCLLESYVSSYPAIDGKHKIIQRLYAARENIIDSAATYTDPIPQIITKKKYQGEYSAYIDLLTKLLVSKDNILPEKAKQIIHESIEIYLNENFPYYDMFTSKVNRFLKYLIYKIDLLKIINQFRKINHRKNNNALDKLDTMIGFEDWHNIEKHIQIFSKLCYK